ncbi:ABC transporter ATP-binding protein [Mangrovitalea sediminis]|uniref:ABC transporter ATP-binding protein n=1 Tax=Mangrovitalea sediminis TaxID=1982043 RepID=UPI000BE53056|nr:ABC transporter ATP-binding protein [Mangrovitalea sediminis]
MSETILKVEKVEAGYGEVQVLWGTSLEVPGGHLTTIVGANGAGKTTTLRSITGIVKPTSGRIIFEGEDVTRLPTHAKAELGLVLVPEGRQLFADMTVEENLEMGAFGARARAHYDRNLERVCHYFPRVKERLQQKAGTLSGGEQQMVAVGRGLMAEPKVLMIDEMSLGLSPLLAQQLFQTLKELRDDGLTLLLVEQNVHLALALADYAYVLAEGKVHLEGPAQEVSHNDEIRKAYLGL